MIEALAPEGVMVTQATSTLSPHASTVASTVAATQPDRQILPFSTNVPSFGVGLRAVHQDAAEPHQPAAAQWPDHQTGRPWIMRTKPACNEFAGSHLPICDH